jgi:hypothetical protein
MTLSDGSVLGATLLATADRNMGLDWTRREALRAGLKISLKRAIVHFGLADRHPELVAEKLVELIRDHVSDPEYEIPPAQGVLGEAANE